ncbi:MAG: xylose isomerase, partial [Ignavibacteria bacterium]
MSNYFVDVKTQIKYEGKDSKNPLAFKYYNKDQKVGRKTMAEHLRCSVAWWHTFMGNGSDMFGGPSFKRDWHKASNSMDAAKETMDAAFEFFQKLGVEY